MHTDLSKIIGYFSPARFRLASILDLLADVEKTAPFLHHLGHQSKSHERKRPKTEMLILSLVVLPGLLFITKRCQPSHKVVTLIWDQ